MPIREINDSLFHIQRGFNWVWRDTNRHRSDPLMLVGPIAKAQPYTVPLQNQIDFFEPKALPGPNGEKRQFPILSELEKYHLQMRRHSNFVLPRPLVEAIVSYSRVGRVKAEYWYYRSKLRIAWAEHELTIARVLMASGSYPSVASCCSRLMGALLPAVLVKRQEATHEYNLFSQAWEMMRMIVDENAFVEMVVKESNYILKENGLVRKDLDDKGFFWTKLVVEDRLFEDVFKKYLVDKTFDPDDKLNIRQMYQRVGPRDLTMAEEISELNERLIKINEDAKDGWTEVGRHFSGWTKKKLDSMMKNYDSMIKGTEFEILGLPRLMALESLTKFKSEFPAGEAEFLYEQQMEAHLKFAENLTNR